MASLHFPNHEALRIALASGLVPASVAKSAVSAFIPPRGGLWLTFERDLPGEAYSSLQRFGARAFGVKADKESRLHPCWPALLPLRPGPSLPTRTEFLVELPVPRLPRFLTLLERLGLPPTRFALLDRTAVVRMEEVPESLRIPEAQVYSTMARNAWCPEGYRPESLPANLLETDGLTLAGPDCRWRCLAEVVWHPTRNIHRCGRSETAHPPGPGFPLRIPVALKLRRSGAPESMPATMWVAKGGVAELARSFMDWDERSLRRVEFAIVQDPEGRGRILISSSPSSRFAPNLTEPFVPYHPIASSLNILCPVGEHLNPNPKPEALDSMFGVEAGSRVLLEPGSNGFTIVRSHRPEFRPFAQLFTYTAAPESRFESLRDPLPLFGFPGFVVAAESKPAGDALVPPKLPDPRPDPPPRSGSWWTRLGGKLFRSGKDRVRNVPHASQLREAAGRAETDLPNEWAIRRRHLERTLATMPAEVAEPVRAEAWTELAKLARTMGHAKDAADAWVAAIWYRSQAPLAWYESWYRSELDASKIPGYPSDDQLAEQSGEAAVARVLAARLSLLAAEHPDGPSARRWPDLHRAVQRHAPELPVRVCWLARLAASRLSQGDVLGLANERDAIFARLSDGGLDADLDSPGFLRYQGKLGVDRYHSAVEWLRRTRESAQRWVKSMPAGGRLQWSGLEGDLPGTRAYADLVFACGAAKLGDRQKCREWMEGAETVLDNLQGPGVEHPVHRNLFQTFQRWVSHRHRWKSENAYRKADLEQFRQKQHSTYAVEKLLSRLTLFEPYFKTDPYGHRGLLSLLPNPIADPRTLLEQANRDRTAGNHPPRILLALELAEDASATAEVLAELPLALELLPETLRGLNPGADVHSALTRHRVRSVELAGRAAAKFGLAEGFAKLCASLRQSWKQEPRSLGDLRAACLHRILGTCRTLNLLDEISEFLNLPGPSASAPPIEHLPRAVGWYALGEDDRGLKILNDARHQLFEGRSAGEKERGDTALAYALALAHAPAAMVPGRLEELFQRLDSVPTSGAASRYYALRPLEIIDAAVAAVVTDDFDLEPAARTWLMDDEFRLRRKIHRDMDRALRGDAP
jgi:hypothetical protein